MSGPERPGARDSEKDQQQLPLQDLQQLLLQEQQQLLLQEQKQLLLLEEQQQEYAAGSAAVTAAGAYPEAAELLLQESIRCSYCCRSISCSCTYSGRDSSCRSCSNYCRRSSRRNLIKYECYN